MGEVREKASKIAKNAEKEMKKLESDPIRVVRGPSGELFVTDHHHGGRAWLLAGYTSGICHIQTGPTSTDPSQFWPQIEALHKVRLADEHGATIT
jgi:hypothetical protein